MLSPAGAAGPGRPGPVHRATAKRGVGPALRRCPLPPCAGALLVAQRWVAKSWPWRAPKHGPGGRKEQAPSRRPRKRDSPDSRPRFHRVFVENGHFFISKFHREEGPGIGLRLPARPPPGKCGAPTGQRLRAPWCGAPRSRAPAPPRPRGPASHTGDGGADDVEGRRLG